MSRRTLFSLLLAGLSALVALPAPAGAGASERVVRVGLYENAPKLYTGADGRPAGLFADLLGAIARAEGWRLDWQPCDWQACLQRLTSGQLDLMPDVAFSAERAARMDFHGVSVANSWSQVYSDPQLRVQTLADLAGRRVAVLAGGIQRQFLADLMSAADQTYEEVPVSSLAAGYEAVVSGRADAVVTNSFFAAHNGSRYQLWETPLVFLPTTLYYAAPKGRNADLLARIDEHLRDWRADADSVYFEAMRRSMSLPPEIWLPDWARWSLGWGALGLAGLLGVSLLLRWQVSQRTRALRETAEALRVERGHLEQAVGERTAELQALFDSASAGIVLAQGRIIQRCNRRLDEMFGYAPGEQIGQSTRIWYPDDAAFEAVGTAMYAAVAAGRTFTTEVEVVRKDGTPFWVRTAVCAIDRGDPSRGAVGILTDITDERAAREQLIAARALAEQATRAKSEFLANMSHEIRTPMNAILGMLYLALRHDRMTPGLRAHLTKAQGAAHSLLALINDILDFSRIEAGRLELERVEFGLELVLEQLTDAIGGQATQKGLEFLIRYDVNIPPRLVGDPLRLRQVLLNLCGNAVKFTEAGEVVLSLQALTTADDAVTLEVCVRDSGIGMAPEVQQRLFEKFSQGDASTTRRFGGTGLGLAICRNLVALMGGRIWVADSAPGGGTTICFTANLGLAGPAIARRGELVAQVGPLLAGLRVLVVDDNAVSREILAEMLHYFRLEVGVAEDAGAALRQLEAGPLPDLLLVDWRMPGMNGDELVRRVRATLPAARQPRVIMVTGYGREEVLHAGEQAGVDGFLLKPVSPSALLDTMLTVLGRGRLPGVDGARTREPGASGRPALTGLRLLVAEDNEINRDFAIELLRGEGVEVTAVADGAAALARVQQQAFDLVLMDIQMPVMDGLEAARRIRALGANPGQERLATLPILAMTALAMAQDAERSAAAGMNGHITKPLDPDQLLTLLGRYRPAPVPDQAGVTPGRSGDLLPASAPDRATTPTKPLPADLAALTRFAAAEGVRRIGGHVEAYRRQLSRFRAHYADAPVQLRQRLARDPRAAFEYVHALKGVTGNLGATELFDQCAALQAVLAAGQSPDDRAQEMFEQAFEAALAELAASGWDSTAPADRPAGADDPRSATPLTGDDQDRLLAELAAALEFDLGAAEPLLARLRAALAGTPTAAAVAEIAALVDRFDTDEALRAVTTLRERLAGGRGRLSRPACFARISASRRPASAR